MGHLRSHSAVLRGLWLMSRRWLRLIFTRELPFGLALRLWDGVFAEDPGLGLLDFICVAMLLLIRNERTSNPPKVEAI
jgi:hypothetical protein